VEFDRGRNGEWACTAEDGGAPSLPPQSPQYLAADGFAAPQAGQSIGNGVPHAVQNFVPARLTSWQPGHSIESPRRQSDTRDLDRNRAFCGQQWLCPFSGSIRLRRG
jgi:hypothetical protein